jgi:hypothetical protein
MLNNSDVDNLKQIFSYHLQSLENIKNIFLNHLIMRNNIDLSWIKNESVILYFFKPDLQDSLEIIKEINIESYKVLLCNNQNLYYLYIYLDN